MYTDDGRWQYADRLYVDHNKEASTTFLYRVPVQCHSNTSPGTGRDFVFVQKFRRAGWWADTY